MPIGFGRTRAFPLFDPLKSFDPDSIWNVEPVWESHFGLSDPAFHYTSIDKPRSTPPTSASVSTP